MNSLCSAALSYIDNSIDAQVALCGGCRTNIPGFISLPYMLSSAISSREDRDGLYAHLAAGSHDADGNFTPVSDKYFVEHYFVLPNLNLCALLLSYLNREAASNKENQF